MFTALIPLALAQAPPHLEGWDVRVRGEVEVGCTQAGGEPWCRAVATVPAPLASVRAKLLDFPGYVETFARVTRVALLAPDVVWVTMDLPFPLADRDYVARFTTVEERGVVRIHWHAAEHAGAPRGAAIRLERTAGTWTLEPVPDGTRVTYTWHGGLGGDVPSAALPTAHALQGQEVLGGLLAGFR